MNKPSKYHESCYIGKGNKDADEYGYTWLWNSSHEDLEPTNTFQIGNTHYCSYCCKKAYPIQSRLKKSFFANGIRHLDLDKWHYETTGYCCICESAEKEKEFNIELKKLNEEYINKEQQLRNNYKQVLKHDLKGRMDLKHKRELRDLEFSGEHYRFKD